MDIVAKDVQHPDNDVLTLTVYKLEPECLNYIFKMRSKYEPENPEHLEQLVVMLDVIKKLKKRAESALIGKYVEMGREVRRTLLDQRIKGEASANDRSTGGEPKPN